MDKQSVDRDNLREIIRKLNNQDVFYMLDEAIGLLPPTKLLKLAKRFLSTSSLQLSNKEKGSILAQVQAFEKASLNGKYYESFDVNSKNCTEESKGTSAWIAECNRLLDHCMIEEKDGNPAEICQAFNIIFGLLDHIDECLDDVIFFADEGGAWQVYVDWGKILPCWFKVLSLTVSPEEYAYKIIALLRSRCSYEREKMIPIAHKIASPTQQKALAEAEKKETIRRNGR